PGDTFDVNNAQSVAILPDLSYAFVAGHNSWKPGLPSFDPNYDPLDPAGSNIGIIKDPFGLHGQPTLVAATRPIPWGYAEDLALSRDGKALFASYTGTGAVFAFDLERIRATVEAQPPDWLRTVPVDDLDPAIDINADYRLDASDKLHPRFRN